MRFVVSHPLPPGTTRQEVEQMKHRMATAPGVTGYRSFLNLSEGRGFCVFDAPSEERLRNWLAEQELPYDSILTVELEGDGTGNWTELPVGVHAHSGR